MAELRIGVDVGGSGVKAGLVDVERGTLEAGRLRLDTPDPSTPAAVTEVVAELVGRIEAPGTVGIGFPSVVRDGVVYTASNIDRSWLKVDAGELFAAATGREVVVINDADAAGIAEARFGAAAGVPGKVLVLTFGTGIGSALFHDGTLVPNLELGQLELDGVRPAELSYSAKARKREELSWEEWGRRTRRFIILVSEVLSPDLVVVGGGISKSWSRFGSLLDVEDTRVVPASLGNDAGIVGAAVHAEALSG